MNHFWTGALTGLSIGLVVDYFHMRFARGHVARFVETCTKLSAEAASAAYKQGAQDAVKEMGKELQKLKDVQQEEKFRKLAGLPQAEHSEEAAQAPN